MKTLCLVEDKYSDKIIHTTRRLKDEGIDTVILTLDERVENKLKNLNVPCRSILNYFERPTEKHYEHRIACELIKKWGEIEIDKNIKLKDLASHRNISLWNSHQVEMQLYFIARMIRQIDIAKYIIEKEKPERMIIAVDLNNIVEPDGIRFDKFLLKALFEIGKSESVDIIYLGLPDSSVKKLLIILKPFLALGRDIIRKIQFSLRNVGKNKRKHYSKTKIMFVNHTDRNTDAIIPIIKRMKENKESEFFVVQLGPDGEKIFRTESIPYRRVEEYLTSSVTVHIFLASLLNLKKWSLLNKLIDRQSNVRKGFFYQNIDIWDLGNETFQYFWSVLSRAIRNIELANSVIEIEKPCIIIGTNERSGNYRVFYELAKIRNIPFLSIQYGLINDHPLWHVPIAADIMAVDGRKTIDCISRAGGSTDKLIVTGQPKYDTLRDRYSNISKDEVSAKYGLEPKKKLVLYTSHTASEEQSGKIRFSTRDELSKYSEEIYAIYEALSRMTDVQLVVKPHPDNERIDLHHEVFKKVASPNIHIVSSQSDVNELITVCDVLITRHSTTGLDALIMGKRLVVVNLTGEGDRVPYVEYGAALGAYKKQDVFPVIKDACNEKMKWQLIDGREKFISDFAYRNDGKASQRITGLIEELCCRN